MTGAMLLEAVVPVAIGLILIGLLLTFYRIVRGPKLPDRAIGLDVFATAVVGLIAIYCIQVQQAVFLDAAVVLALVAFLGTVAYARYIERGSHPS